nr:snurportin 1 [Hymenolepis microstoma]
MDYDIQMNGLSQQLSTLSGADQIQVTVNSHTDSPHRSLYKNTKPAEDQARRWRNELFEVERNAKRRDKFNSNRDLNQAKNPWSEKPANKIDKRGRHARKRSMIMLAEWFLFMPKNFETEYLFKLCPKGRHVCVVAWKGRTDVYARSGTRIESFLSRLPGGGLGQSSLMMHRYKTVLDCIMIDNRQRVHRDSFSSESIEEKLIFMVLDLISFKSTSYDDITFLERCEWMESYHQSHIEAYEHTDSVQFKLVPVYGCDKDTMQSVFSSPPPFEVDGVLFYHSCVYYRCGQTPLVGWVKPYMLPDWFPFLKDTLHPIYLTEMPEDYKDIATDIARHRELTKAYAAALQEKRKDEALSSSSNQTGDVEMPDVL